MKLFNFFKSKALPPDEVWTTKDGRKIAVRDMHEEHVRNVLRMILRRRRELLEASFPDSESLVADALWNQEMENDLKWGSQ